MTSNQIDTSEENDEFADIDTTGEETAKNKFNIVIWIGYGVFFVLLLPILLVALVMDALIKMGILKKENFTFEDPVIDD